MTLAIPLFAFSNLKQTARTLFAQLAAAKTLANSADDTTREDRDFFLEMMARNPKAVQIDLGCMAIMTLYPRHF